MEKKKTTAKKDPRKEFQKRFNIPRNHEEHLLSLLKATEKAISKERTTIDDLFIEQAIRLRKELGLLRKK